MPGTDLIGKKLGKYTILEEIGRGGMATVYRAQQPSMQRPVAIKVLPPYFLHNPDFFERFGREVEVVSSLEHPHILPIYDYGKDEDTPYIVMRFLGGGSLAQGNWRGVESLLTLEKPLSQVAEALDYAHQHGVIHRDIKPGNIMLDENSNAYLSDFGIARVMNSELTGTAIVGTPAYMSPEQANGMPIDGYSDIYALGIVLFELITGRRPFESESLAALLLKHISEELPSARGFRADIPIGVEMVLSKATAKKPTDRYGSAVEMANAFSTALFASTRPISAGSLNLPDIDDGKTKVLVDFDKGMTLCLETKGDDEPLCLQFGKRQSYVFGRLEDMEVDVDVDMNPFGGFEQGISRRHAIIEMDASTGSLTVEDLDSANGTYLNSSKLSPGTRYPLNNGDRLRLARVSFTLSFE
jgi:serine/threonine protein kinase